MTLKLLSGHISPETAYVVERLPLRFFRLRCKIRYWIEYKPKKGFSLCVADDQPEAPR